MTGLTAVALLLQVAVSLYLLLITLAGMWLALPWYLPWVYLSVFWAVSIHLVTAFLMVSLAFVVLPELPDLTTVDRRIVGQTMLGRGILAITVTDAPREVLRVALENLPKGERGPDGEQVAVLPKIVAAVSPDVPLEDRNLLMWGIFTRFDPARDVFFDRSQLHGAWPVHRGRMAIDATFKPGYPAPLEMDPEW